MTDNDQYCPSCQNSGKNTGNNADKAKTRDMARKERRAFVLEVLQDAGVAMRSIDIFRACKLRGGMFEHRTTKNYLSQLIDSGDVLKVESSALNDGQIVEIDTDERGHFIAASIAEQYGSDR